MSFTDGETAGTFDFGVVAGGEGMANNFRPLSGPFLQELQTLLPAIRPPLVTTLPANPGAGSEVYLQADLTNGIYWHLAFLPEGDTYQWKFLGGPPLYTYITTSEATSSTSYANLGSVGPFCTIPANGDYIAAFGCSSYNGTAATVNFMGASINNATPVDNDAARFGHDVINSEKPMTTTRRFTGANMANAIGTQYRTTGGTATFFNRWLAVLPIRLG